MRIVQSKQLNEKAFLSTFHALKSEMIQNEYS